MKVSPSSFCRCIKITIFILLTRFLNDKSKESKLLEQSKVFGSAKLFKTVTAAYVFI